VSAAMDGSHYRVSVALVGAVLPVAGGRSSVCRYGGRSSMSAAMGIGAVLLECLTLWGRAQYTQLLALWGGHSAVCLPLWWTQQRLPLYGGRLTLCLPLWWVRQCVCRWWVQPYNMFAAVVGTGVCLPLWWAQQCAFRCGGWAQYRVSASMGVGAVHSGCRYSGMGAVLRVSDAVGAGAVQGVCRSGGRSAVCLPLRRAQQRLPLAGVPASAVVGGRSGLPRQWAQDAA
jgi:hypothetical protein